MSRLHDRITQSVLDNRYLFSDHADNMLRERGIPHWQVLDGIGDAILLSERPGTKPNPTIELRQTLPDGTSVKVVWAFIDSLDLAKLVTVHFFDR